MIVLTLEQGEAEKLAEGAPGLQRRYGMPIDPAPYPRPASSEPACAAVVAGRLCAPLDDREVLAAAARDVDIDPARLVVWCAEPDAEAARQADIEASRRPHRRSGIGGRAGFNPVEAYDSAIANLAPELERRPRPESVEELLAWAGEPLATAEVAAVMELGTAHTRTALGRVAQPHAAGADFYWTVEAR
jgi:hypothetical protein